MVPNPNPDTGPDEITTAGAADLPAATPPAAPARPAPRLPTVTLEPTHPRYVPPPLPAMPPPGYPAAVQTPAPEPRESSTSQKPRQETRPAEDDPQKRAQWTRLPGRNVIFQMYTDPALEKIIVDFVANENKIDPAKIPFPPVVNRVAPPGAVYTPKTVNYPPGKVFYEPSYVVHRRLHFEEKNAERYGWDFGIVQPVISTLYFYKDTLLWPNSLGTGLVTGFWDTSAGKCLPGSPVPYLLYPPNITMTGMLFEGGLLTGIGFVLAPVNALPASTAALIPK
jgi:hypothetical protein